MSNIIIRPPWHLPERLITPEAAYLRRREFLKQMGLAGAGVLSSTLLAGAAAETVASKKYPARRNPEYNPGWKLTDEKTAGSYNNFYEFSLQKDRVKELVGNFITTPWPIEIKGLVEKPMTIDAAELVETMVTTRSRQHRHQLVRRVEKPRQALCRVVDDEACT